MKIASNGIQIHIEERGGGDLSLVFLHYWGGSSRTWDKVIAALPKSYRSIATDHRGWGESDAPANGYGLADLAADAQGVIEALDLKRYVLVGHSMGGKVAQLMASRRPKGLAGLVLVAPSPPQPLAIPPEARETMAGAYSTRESVGAAIDQMLSARVLSLKDRDQVIEDSLRGAPQAKAAWPRSTSLEDITRDVAAINVPTIVIAGELDRVDSVDLIKTELLSRIPHATLHVLSGTGHLSPLESPQEIARLIGEFVKARAASEATPERNKALVLEAFDTLFNKRDYAAAERYWSDHYIQHSAHISPGRDGLFNLVRTAPSTLKYENHVIAADGDYVIAHGRFSGNGRPVAWVAADIVRIEDGKLAEHWDVLQDEVTRAQSLSGRPMFGDRFAD
ncbi:alpha/beta fold hydrolase [Methylocapsa sp. S129]|uniref:alpha/beta fold hydrolase n=1 Tax=Methylocapsa sp. S129 TaxID=1641869 RepID=UPI00131A997B|nr:alpha/beta fold hydrolase [Methylocapsa sp. S129]